MGSAGHKLWASSNGISLGRGAFLILPSRWLQTIVRSQPFFGVVPSGLQSDVLNRAGDACISFSCLSAVYVLLSPPTYSTGISSNDRLTSMWSRLLRNNRTT